MIFGLARYSVASMSLQQAYIVCMHNCHFKMTNVKHGKLVGLVVRHTKLLVLWSSCLATKVLTSKHLATEGWWCQGGGAMGRIGEIDEYQQVCCSTLNWGPLDHASRGPQLRVL